MKKILFVRHAKSSWSHPEFNDHDRPLNKRGKRDAPMMAKRCKEASYQLDIIVSSTAKRALHTAREFHKLYDIDKDIITHKFLYHGDPSDFEEALQLLDDSVNHAAIFGHNPGITYLANDLDSNKFIDNVPTTGIVVAETDIDYWSDFHIPSARLMDFMYPKQLL